jgi:glycosyltransferase involved in cell wall biosynthesis
MSKFILDVDIARQKREPEHTRSNVTLVQVKLSLMEYIAILGRREEPTDGVQDYCCYLKDALAREGVNLTAIQVRWAELGWKASRKELLKAIEGKKNACFLLQYTALAWSRRGFALPVVGILKLLKKNGARCAIVFHDPDGYAGNRAVDRFRRRVQEHAMKQLVQLSDLIIFTLPLEKILWLPEETKKFAFIPVGANLTAPERAWEGKREAAPSKPVVAVFSLSHEPLRSKEVQLIAEAAAYTAKQIGPLEVVVLGRNSESGGEELRAQLAGSLAEVKILGLIAADDVVHALQSSDVMLFVRGPISSRRGSALAGIACGLPVIAQDGLEVGPQITEAGVVLVPEHSTHEFGPALVRVLADPSYRASLAQRSRDAQSRYFSWKVIARQYVQALRALGVTSRE